jgi:hypothetical protein
VLDRVDALLRAGESIAQLVEQNARLQQRKLELEIKRLEQAP